MAGIPRNLTDIKVGPIKTPEQLLAEVDRQIEISLSVTQGFRKAQPERQEAIGIRGGGAPSTRAEAQDLIRVAGAARKKLKMLSGATMEEQRAALDEAREALTRLNQLTEGAKVVILFRSGGPFIYPTSVPSDYLRITEAPSKGKAVWQIGWGPNRSPTYALYQPKPERTIEEQAVSSSWLLKVWLAYP